MGRWADGAELFEPLVLQNENPIPAFHYNDIYIHRFGRCLWEVGK